MVNECYEEIQAKFYKYTKKNQHQNKTKKNKMKFRNFREMLQWCSTKYLTVNSQRELREMGIDQYCLLIMCYQDFYYYLFCCQRILISAPLDISIFISSSTHQKLNKQYKLRKMILETIESIFKKLHEQNC